LKQDVETAKQHPKPTDDRFVGMEVKGVFYSEKADAGKAIIEVCKQMNSPDPIPLGKDIRVICARSLDAYDVYTLEELLPNSFGPDDLD
jgi:hypothetical protein